MRYDLTLTIISLLAAASGQAQTIVAEYTFSSNSFASSDADTNSTASDITFPGISGETAGVSLQPGIDGSVGQLAPAYVFYMGNINDQGDDDVAGDTDAAEFSVTPSSSLDFTSFSFDFQKNSGGADIEIDLFWSVDSYATAIDSYTISDTGSWGSFSTDLSSLANQATTTTFRLQFFTTGGSPGNELYLDNVELQAVPEPSAFALLAGCLGLTWIMVRRR
ncbi:hypothetical protein DDZ13_02630 [Coraliomargarita sinensis]|uniref:PEP-CTERM protein-sorting domain-containing protein n=1 Tax=Coraliomargarita sinensis TaxID=2174842 RepID=A0A317ZLR9_9BACT|nr:PEP-CTERM sorting domain-containing protein [Coraliomargarita sinensis]PXA04878.1 hypothetical protein DDZ13_02630 [Coraliomargarita sinensis]